MATTLLLAATEPHGEHGREERRLGQHERHVARVGRLDAAATRRRGGCRTMYYAPS
jgi:hypothetical protein